MVRLEWKCIYDSPPRSKNLAHELILPFDWYHYDLQPNILVFLAEKASKQVRFGSSNCWFYWQKMARLEWKHIYDFQMAVHTPKRLQNIVGRPHRVPMQPFTIENVSSKSFGGRQSPWEAKDRLTLPSDFLHIVGFIGRKWQGWSGKTSMIPTLRFIHLTDELTLIFYWCQHALQPYMLIFLDKNASKEASFALNCELDR